jgi:hypothetical protein
MVKLTVVPVIPLAFVGSSASVMSRHGWVLLASSSCHCSQVIPIALAWDWFPDPAINPSGLNSRFGAIP